MFHLSLPVGHYRECLAFYRSCFGAEIVELTATAANLFVFGAQITLHDDPTSPLAGTARKELHFGPVVSTEEWFAIRDRILSEGHLPSKCVEPDEASDTRGKLVVADPSGNLVEVNTGRA